MSRIGLLLLYAGLMLLIFGTGGVLVWVAYGLPLEPRTGAKDEPARRQI